MGAALRLAGAARLRGDAMPPEPSILRIFARAFIQAVPAQETATQIREINMNLSAIDDHGKPVDWWFMYKVAGKSKSSTGDKVTGTEYVYFDSNMASGGKLSLSPNRVDADGALPNTLRSCTTKRVR